MKIKIILFVLLGFAINTAHATNWYVNVNIGNDTLDGTSATIGGGSIGPKQTINAALGVASSNDTIYVSEGLYQEFVFINKAIVLRGNNFGIDGNAGLSRNPETFIVPPSVATGTSISGNSVVEITSCCIELDGFYISGDNPKLTGTKSYYGKEYEASYCIGGVGTIDDLHITNNIVSNFMYAGMNLSGGLYATKRNKIDYCLVKGGEFKSDGIKLTDNFYTNISNVTIDSTGRGLGFYDFSDKANRQSRFSFLTIRSEMVGIAISDFLNFSDSLYFEFSNITSLDPAQAFNGFWLNNLASTGRIDMFTTTINNADKAYYFNNCGTNMIYTLSDQSIFDVNYGIYGIQGGISPDIQINLFNTSIKNADSSAVYLYSDGGLTTLNTKDVVIKTSKNGLVGIGNVSILPTNTQFETIAKYYMYLDSTAAGIYPTTAVDARNCVYEGTSGNSLSNREPFNVEDKIHHYLDNPKLGWILFDKQNIYVTDFDGNSSLARAINIAQDDWNIFLDSINTYEDVTFDRRINLYSHRKAAIGSLKMNYPGISLFLFGKLTLQTGLNLTQGLIEVSDFDTLLVFRDHITTRLTPGKTNSYVKGTLYVQYQNMPTNYTIVDTIPIGNGVEFRPFYLTATWLFNAKEYVQGYRLLNGKAPMNSLPAGITHTSDIRYWEVIKPYKQTPFLWSYAGLSYGIKANDDLVNDPNNLRVIYISPIKSNNIGGSGSAAGNGTILSTFGSPGPGYYTFGNFGGGNNMLSTTTPIALVKASGFCANDSIVITAVNSRSFNPITSYDWKITGPSTVSTPEKTMVIKKVVPVEGKYTVTVIVTNSTGGKDTASTQFDILPLPNISYSVLQPCFPLPMALTNTAIPPSGYSITQTEWKINSTYFTTPNLNYTPTVVGPQTGHLKVTLNSGCFDSILVSFNSPAAPVIQLSPNGKNEICNGDSMKVMVNKSAGVVLWNDGNTYDSLILKTNTYKKATIFATAQCYRSDSVELSILARPTVSAGPDLVTLPGKPVTILGASDAMVEWTPVRWLDDPTYVKPISRALSTTTYTIRAYNTFGCESTDTMKVIVNSNNNSAIPNLLTPNGDGHNDLWVLTNFPDKTDLNVNIYNREGVMVFDAAPYKNDFDGKFDGKILPDGYYVYVVKLNATGEVFTGILSILK
jgi:gliding motility-associated-like protein